MSTLKKYKPASKMNKINVAERNANKRAANKRTAKTPLKESRFSWKAYAYYFKWFVIASCSAGFLTTVVYFGGSAANNFMNRPIAEIVIESDFKYVNRDDIAQYMKGMIGRSFIGESINTIRQDVNAMVWVDSVSLSRQWPEKLVISLTEQKPIARWGSQGFVNVRGELVTTTDTKNINHLPELNSQSESNSGENNNDVFEVMQQYHTLAQVFSKQGMSIKDLHKDKRDAWKVELVNGWKVMLGRSDLLKKVERLTYLIENDLLNNIAVIDLRYNNGVSIKHAVKDQAVVATVVATVDATEVEAKVETEVKTVVKVAAKAGHVQIDQGVHETSENNIIGKI